MFHSASSLSPCQSPSTRPRHSRDETSRKAGELYADALEALRRGNMNRARHRMAALADLGFGITNLDPGYKLVDLRPSTVPMPRPSRMPVVWMAKLVRALSEADTDLEERAISKLADAGFEVRYDPRMRRREAMMTGR